MPNTVKTGRKKSAEFLSQLLNTQSPGQYAHYNAQWSIQTDLTGPTIHVGNFSDQHFWPVTFYKDQKPIGGAYLHPWLCGKATFNHLHLSLKTTPITAFVTYMCLLGDSLKGLDTQGKPHPLTNPKYDFPPDTSIITIVTDDDFHPYEKLVQYNLINLYTLFKACSAPNTTPLIDFHLPIPEYFLYGIQWHLDKKTPLSALNETLAI